MTPLECSLHNTGMAHTAYTSYVLDPQYKAVLLYCYIAIGLKNRQIKTAKFLNSKAKFLNSKFAKIRPHQN